MTLRVLQVHNRYFAGRGGEDSILEQEAEMLQKYGHSVTQMFVTTQASDIEGLRSKLRTAVKTVWSKDGYHLMTQNIADVKPDVVHVHNTFPLLSPSIYWAAARAGVPVVQTLHNYRLTCANALLQRENSPCEACVGKLPLPALRHRCYKGSIASTLPLVAMQVGNRAKGSYGKVNAYIVLNEFSKRLMARAGLPESKIVVKPNFLIDPLDKGTVNLERKRTFVFVGKLVPEKSVDLLIEAWMALKPHGYRLVIIGDGTERKKLQAQAGAAQNIDWLGWLDKAKVLETVQSANSLVLSSRWYEGQPMVLIEALSVGTPIIVPNLGALPELTDAQQAGRVFEGGSAESLRDTLQQAMDASPQDWNRMAQAARSKYLSQFTMETNYQQLIRLYENVIGEKTAR